MKSILQDLITDELIKIRTVFERSVRLPPTKWINDVAKAAGSKWIQAASNRGRLMSMGVPAVGILRLM